MGPCVQSDNIIEMKGMLKEITAAMAKIAAQDERLDGMEAKNNEKNKEQDHALDVLFERVRVLDMAVGNGGETIKLKILSELTTLTRILELMNSKIFLSIVGGLVVLILVGSLIDAVYHYEFMTLILKKVPR